MNDAMARVYKNVIYFSKQNWRSDDFGLRNPVIGKYFSRNLWPLSIVERVFYK